MFHVEQFVQVENQGIFRQKEGARFTWNNLVGGSRGLLKLGFAWGENCVVSRGTICSDGKSRYFVDRRRRARVSRETSPRLFLLLGLI